MSLEREIAIANAAKVYSADTINRIADALHKGKIDAMDEKDQLVYEMINFADDQVKLYGPGKKAADVVATKFNVSKSLGDRICRSAQILFGSRRKFEKDYWKSYAIEKIVRAIQRMEKEMGIDDESEKEGKTPTGVSAQMMKSYQGLIKELRETIGYDKDDLDIPDFSQIGSTVIIAMADPSLLQIDEAKNLDEKLNEMFNNLDAEDAEVNL